MYVDLKTKLRHYRWIRTSEYNNREGKRFDVLFGSDINFQKIVTKKCLSETNWVLLVDD